MAHFAHINEDSYVDSVIVVEPEQIARGEFGDPKDWVQTSYNTFAGRHTDPVTNVKSENKALRKNFAGLGDFYDKAKDAFTPPKAHKGWVLDEETCQWVAPQSVPDKSKSYRWDDATEAWALIEE